MGIFGRRSVRSAAPAASSTVLAPHLPIVVGDTDLVRLREWLDSYSAVGGRSHAEVEPVIIALARLGGSGPPEVLLRDPAFQLMDSLAKSRLLRRPWDWMLRTAEEAGRRGDAVLAVRAAMFVSFWAEHFGSRLGTADMVALGLGEVMPVVQVEAATLGLMGARQLPPDTPVAWDTTSVVLARDALTANAMRLTILHRSGQQIPPDALAAAQAVSGRSAG